MSVDMEALATKLASAKIHAQAATGKSASCILSVDELDLIQKQLDTRQPFPTVPGKRRLDPEVARMQEAAEKAGMTFVEYLKEVILPDHLSTKKSVGAVNQEV